MSKADHSEDEEEEYDPIGQEIKCNKKFKKGFKVD